MTTKEKPNFVPHIRRVYIENYKSIGKCAVILDPLTILVGPNGSGKSNFIDAIAFVQEALSGSIEGAFKQRAGIGAVRRLSGGHPTHIGIRLEMLLDRERWADYSFHIASREGQRYSVARERCRVGTIMGPEFQFEIKEGVFVREIPGIKPKMASDRLALFAASATDEFRPIYDFLTAMRFYSIAPARIRELQEPDAGDYLKKEGENAAAILKRIIQEKRGNDYERLCRLLSRVVRGIKHVEYRAIGNKETLKFKQDVGLKSPWTFDAWNMSDGTLRVLGILLAVFQPATHTVIGIEEPEATVHPAASEVLVDVLRFAANERQIILSTHSPDILDQESLTDAQIRAVHMEKGTTTVAPIAASGRRAMREKLYTAGELLRNGELPPDDSAARDITNQLSLFGRQFPEG